VVDAALALVLIIFYWGVVVANVFKIKRETNKAPHISPTTKEEKPLQLGWRVVVLGLAAQPLVILLAREPWLLFRPLETFDPTAFSVVGTLLVIAGIIGTRRCYVVMGRHWNMWIDPSQEGPLIDRGPYRRVRHPIYAFQILVSVGIWCLIPTPFLLGIVLLNAVCIWIKSSGEERFLLEGHGDIYRDYLSRTGRFFPKL
jgi:protein-S-isoprenylcysteine O-methyltransferase Ste14